MSPSNSSSPVSSPSRLYHGAAWYPEQWNADALDHDLRLMQELGINVVRVAEFAWTRIEPKEGEVSTDWLLKALDLLESKGIKAIVCTPTATPPQWLLKKYPEIGYQEPDDYQHKHGARQHACYNNPTFRAHSSRIVESVASTVGSHPAVIGWQIDNEFRGHQKICICLACRQRWSHWLRERYGSIEQLNAEWGTQVWSYAYSSFEDVPSPYRVCGWSHHFSVLINYRRFMSESVIDFQREQLEVIRRFSTAPATHNSEDSVSEWHLGQDLDFVSGDIYVNSVGTTAARMRLDSLRPLKPGRRFWTMETSCDPLIASEMMPASWLSCFAFLNYVSGAEAFLYWCWRQHRTGTEIQHSSPLYSSGKPTPGWEEARKVEAMRKSLEPVLRNFSPAPADVALIRSEYNGHYFFTDRIGGLEANFSYSDRFCADYAALQEIGAWTDVVFDEADMAGYRVVFSPYLPNVSPTFLTNMIRHLESGGAWIIGPYCGYRERDHTVPTSAILGTLETTLGFKTKYFCPGGDFTIRLSDGTLSNGSMYATVFEPKPEDEVLGVYENSRFMGLPWGISRSVGKGRIYVLGSELDHAGSCHLLSLILDREKIERVPLPAKVWRVPQRSSNGTPAWALSNWDNQEHVIKLPFGSSVDLLNGKRLADSIALQPFTNVFVSPQTVQ